MANTMLQQVRGVGIAERLEPRRLLSAVLDEASGVLTVTGSDGVNDIVQIRVAESDAGAAAPSFEVIESSTSAAAPPRVFPTRQEIIDYLDTGEGVSTQSFPLSAVRELRVVSGGGDDLVILGNRLPVPAFVDAGDGNDSVSGGKSDDTILGGAGDDYLFGGGRNDILDGGTGADELLGGAGLDTGDYSARSAGVTVVIDNTAGDGEAAEGDNVRSDVESVVGGLGDDLMSAPGVAGNPGVSFFGNDGDDTLSGGPGDDKLFGGPGLDSLSGGDGNDALFSDDEHTTGFDEDDDMLDGGAGDDLAVFHDVHDIATNIELRLADFPGGGDPALVPGGTATLEDDGDVIVTGTGQDDIVILQQGEDGLSLFVIEQPDVSTSTRFVSEFEISGPAGTFVSRVLLDLGGGNDVFFGGELPIEVEASGGAGSDLLVGSAGNDFLRGGEGDDLLFGRLGADRLDGGGGADYLSGGGAQLQDIGGDTADYSGRSGDVMVDLGLLPNDGERGEGDNVQTDIETVVGGGGNDRLSTTAGLPVMFLGGPGRDRLFGGAGDDFFNGGAGADTIRGGAGDDVMDDDDEADDIDLGEDE